MTVLRPVRPDRGPTVSEEREQAKFEERQARQLASARATAEKWRDALGALAAVVTGTVLLKGGADLRILATVWRWAFAVTLVAGFVGILGGLWVAATAAFGLPQPSSREQLIGQHGSLLAFDYADALRSRANLLRARVLVAAGIAALLASSFVAWWGGTDGRAASASLALTIDGQVRCGTVIESTPGEVVLRVAGSTRVQAVALDRLEQLDVVENC